MNNLCGKRSKLEYIHGNAECMKNPSKRVCVSDCEKCLSERNAIELCFKRGFVWGCPDESEPRWALTKEEAVNSREDVSMYFDINWEGNSHLIPIKKFIQTAVKIKQSIPPETRWSVWERDNFTCQMCGVRKYLSIDHIYPESKGGTLELSNLQTLCCRCNSKKGDRAD